MPINREKLVEIVGDLDRQVTILKNRAITWKNEQKGSINLTQDQIDQVKTEGINALVEVEDLIDQINSEIGR